ncbi:MAG: HAMP domain-containing sensor histidine kinase [Pirellulales bacterium]
MKHDAQQMTDKLGPLIADVFNRGGQQRVLDLLEQANQERQLLDQPSGEHRVVRVRWVWLDASRDDPYSPKAAISAIRPATQRQIISMKHTEHGEEHLLTYAHVAINGERPAALELDETVTHSASKMRSFATRMMMLTAITLMLSMGMVVLLGSELVGKPLKKLIEKTRRIGQGDLSGPVHLQRHDEFGELATAINSMCEQLVEVQSKATQETAGRIAALEQLRHADRLRTVGRLASGVAHELGTPLNVVGGRAGMIASGNLSEEEMKKSAEIIKNESNRIAIIIRQLLDFARRNTPKRTSIDMRQLVDQTVDLLAPLAEKKGVNIQCIADSQPFRCQVDTGQMQQVITNLLINAVQAMPNDGGVDVDIRRAHVDPPETEEAAAGEFLVLTVRDNGLGIAEEDLEQLFEPFFTTKEVGEGTGLGLSIAYGIVQEHGGWIDVQSEIDKGSCFTVYLPLEIDA